MASSKIKRGVNFYTITGTTPSTQEELLVDYPDGFTRGSTLVLSARVYRTNFQWIELEYCHITNDGLTIKTHDDPTQFNRQFEIVITMKSF